MNVLRIYLWGRSQQRKLCSADVDREGADIKPANQNRGNKLTNQLEKSAAAILQTAWTHKQLKLNQSLQY